MRAAHLLSGALAVGLLALSLGPGCGTKAPPEPVYIGHLAPRSGPQQEVGEQSRFGILLAVEEANAAEGQVAGRPIAVIHPDARGDAETVQAVAVRLLTIDRVSALLASTDAVATEKLSRLAPQYNAPLITDVGLPNQLLTPFGFSVNVGPAEQGRALARFAAQELKVKSVALVADSRGPVNNSLVDAFTAEFTRSEGNKVEPRRYEKKEEVTAALAQQVVKTAPPAVVLVGASAELGALHAELKKQGLGADVPVLLAGEGACSRSLVADGEAGKKVYCAAVYAVDASAPRAQEFAKKFQARFNRPADSSAALAYDGLRVLVEGARRAKGFQGTKLRDELLNLKDFDCLTGTLSFDKDRNARRPVFIVQTGGGEEKVVKRYEPEPTN